MEEAQMETTESFEEALERIGVEAIMITPEEAKFGLELLEQVVIPGRALDLAYSFKGKLEIVVLNAEE